MSKVQMVRSAIPYGLCVLLVLLLVLCGFRFERIKIEFVPTTGTFVTEIGCAREAHNELEDK